MMDTRHNVWNVRHELHIHMTNNEMCHHYELEMVENQMF